MQRLGSGRGNSVDVGLRCTWEESLAVLLSTGHRFVYIVLTKCRLGTSHTNETSVGPAFDRAQGPASVTWVTVTWRGQATRSWAGSGPGRAPPSSNTPTQIAQHRCLHTGLGVSGEWVIDCRVVVCSQTGQRAVTAGPQHRSTARASCEAHMMK